jgi:hypothetical protein
MSCSCCVRFARGDMHMLLGVVWLVWCGILSALYLGERGAGSMLRVVRRLGSSTVPGRRADLRAPKCGTTKPRCGPATCEACPPPSTRAGRKALASSAARFVKY